MADAGPERGSRSIRALRVLEALVAADKPLSAAEITKATGLPKATVHRLTALLEAEGYLAADMGGKGLAAGHRARALALGVIGLGAADAYRHRVLVEVSREIGETCNLTVAQGSEILYVDRVEAEWPLRTQLPIGSRVPLHCTASGKLFLSSLPAARRRRLIETLSLDALTPATITDPARLAAEVEVIRRDGVGMDDEEFVTGMAAAAVPITDARGRLAAMLAVHAPVIRMDARAVRDQVPALRRAAAQISADLAG